GNQAAQEAGEDTPVLGGGSNRALTLGSDGGSCTGRRFDGTHASVAEAAGSGESFIAAGRREAACRPAEAAVNVADGLFADFRKVRSWALVDLIAWMRPRRSRSPPMRSAASSSRWSVPTLR